MSLQSLSWAEFAEKFDPEVHKLLIESRQRPGVVALVLFENQQMDSSKFGNRSALRVGPSCSTKTVEELDGKWLFDLPSVRQYAVAYTTDVPPKGD